MLVLTGYGVSVRVCEAECGRAFFSFKVEIMHARHILPLQAFLLSLCFRHKNTAQRHGHVEPVSALTCVGGAEVAEHVDLVLYVGRKEIEINAVNRCGSDSFLNVEVTLS